MEPGTSSLDRDHHTLTDEERWGDAIRSFLMECSGGAAGTLVKVGT